MGIIVSAINVAAYGLLIYGGCYAIKAYKEYKEDKKDEK